MQTEHKESKYLPMVLFTNKDITDLKTDLTSSDVIIISSPNIHKKVVDAAISALYQNKKGVRKIQGNKDDRSV